MERLRIAVDDADPQRPLVTLVGEMDLDGEPAARSLAERMRTQPEAEWRIDLSGVTFVDSAGLRMLLVIRRALDEDGTIVIVDPSPPVRSLLRMSKLDFFFAIDAEDEVGS